MAQLPGKNQQAYCSNCGQPASGKFCAACGSPLRGATCPACGASLQPGARYCHNCSRKLDAEQKIGSTLAWVAAAVAAVVLALVAVVALRPGPTPPTALPTALTSQGASAAPTTPREEADGLFDRAMIAFETGDSSDAKFSGQMALNAYALLDRLDADAHFHIGLLQRITGDDAAMLARADSIDELMPKHLFAPILRHRAGILTGNDDLINQGYREFLERYEVEGSLQRWEYEVHRRLVESFRTDAVSSGR